MVAYLGPPFSLARPLSKALRDRLGPDHEAGLRGITDGEMSYRRPGRRRMIRYGHNNC
jgi:hypothetical protein